MDDIDDYFNEDKILSNTSSDYQYRDADDMKIIDWHSRNREKKEKRSSTISCWKKWDCFQIIWILNVARANGKSSERLIFQALILNYLFDEPVIMMLYNNPYLLGLNIRVWYEYSWDFKLWRILFSLFLINR